jgi:hypothetical protein
MKLILNHDRTNPICIFTPIGVLGEESPDSPAKLQSYKKHLQHSFFCGINGELSSKPLSIT